MSEITTIENPQTKEEITITEKAVNEVKNYG
jgi:hypothetical protein